MRGPSTIKIDPIGPDLPDPGRLILRSGTVVSAEERTCRVALRRDYCAICPANESADGRADEKWRCGVGFAFPREIELGATGVARGDCVLVGVARAGVSLAAAVVFGLPLGVMLAAAAATQVLWNAGFAGALAGLIGGGTLALLAARRAGLDDWVDPVLVEIRSRRDAHGRR